VKASKEAKPLEKTTEEIEAKLKLAGLPVDGLK
jgi:hypothetical protein